jgi:hypothetical protein
MELTNNNSPIVCGKTITCPHCGSGFQAPRSFFKRHWIISTIGVLIVALAVMVCADGWWETSGRLDRVIAYNEQRQAEHETQIAKIKSDYEGRITEVSKDYQDRIDHIIKIDEENVAKIEAVYKKLITDTDKIHAEYDEKKDRKWTELVEKINRDYDRSLVQMMLVPYTTSKQSPSDKSAMESLSEMQLKNSVNNIVNELRQIRENQESEALRRTIR